MINSLGIVLFFAITPAQEVPSVEATLAWGGAVSSSAFTEVSIRADPGARFSVATADGEPVIQTTLDARDGRAVAVSMPIRPSGAGAVTIRGENGDDTILNAGEILRGNAPIVLVGDSTVAGLETHYDTMAVAASDLPRLASTYANISALVIDDGALARLDEPQLKALLEHIGTCGRMLLVGAAAAVEQMLGQRAGCGGQAVSMVQSDSGIDAELAALLEFRVAALPDARLLDKLADGHSADLRLMAVFLFGFLGVFGVLTIVPQTRLVASGFCLIATVLSATFWNGAPRESFIAWSEVDNGHRIARYAAVERLVAGGRGDQTLQPASLGRSPRAISGQGLEVRWSAAAEERRVDWNTSLLEEAQIVTAGSFPVEPNLRAGINDEAATVCNYGSATSPPSWLRWQGSTYAVPALAPSVSWTPEDAEPVVERRPELRMLARRMQRNTLALLQPLRVPGNGTAQQAWLLRFETDVTELSPCSG